MFLLFVFEFGSVFFDFCIDFQVFTGLNVSLGEGWRSGTSHSRRSEKVPGRSPEGSRGSLEGRGTFHVFCVEAPGVPISLSDGTLRDLRANVDLAKNASRYSVGDTRLPTPLEQTDKGHLLLDIANPVSCVLPGEDRRLRRCVTADLERDSMCRIFRLGIFCHRV